MTPISIHSKNTTVTLTKGKHHIYLLDGWGVELNNFAIELFDNTGNSIVCSKTTVPVQQNNLRKAKRILSVQIPIDGKYQVNFIQPKALILWSSNLFFKKLFAKPINNSELEVYFE